jgi:hypothetical protein
MIVCAGIKRGGLGVLPPLSPVSPSATATVLTTRPYFGGQDRGEG